MRLRVLILPLFLVCLGRSADEITIPIADGHVVIRPQFLRGEIPELSFTIKNNTAYPWTAIKLEFHIGALCGDGPRQWTVPATVSLGWAGDHAVVKEYKDTVIPLVGKVAGCHTEIVIPKLVFAENQTSHFDGGGNSEAVDLDEQLQDLKAQRDA